MAVQGKKGVPKMENTKKVSISVDDTDEMVLRLNGQEGTILIWDPSSFRELKDEVVKMLSKENMENYFKALFANKAEATKASKAILSDVFSPLETRSGYRLKIRPRRGWHSCWKSPGADFDGAMAGPYTQVREPTAQQEKDGYVPGEESGEVKKLLDGEGKVELIAVECRQELFEQHLEAMSLKSARMYSDVKQGFFKATEEINRQVGGRDCRITPVDESGEMQA